MTFSEAIAAVINESNRPYAITYAKAVGEAHALYGDEGVRYQIPYILSNLQHWRGERAREVKAALKTYHKQIGG